MSKSRLLRRQVLLSLAYTAVFNYPLTRDEIYLRLIYSPKLFPVSLTQVEQALMSLKKAKLIDQKDQFYSLSAITPTLVCRSSRFKFAQIKLAGLAPLKRLIQLLPWVRAVAITGSVAMANAKKDDDVDFLIVTQKHRLWLTRLIIVLFAQLMGKRRSFAKEEKNSWCFNFWLEVDQLFLSSGRRNLYTAYDLLQAYWWFDRDRIALQFLRKNHWVKRFLPHFYNYSLSHLQVLPIKQRSSWEERWLSPLWFCLNAFAFLIQRCYMQHHLTNESVGYSFAFFHPRATKRNIYRRWRQLIKTNNRFLAKF